MKRAVESAERSRRLTGVVVSDRMNKTIVVLVRRRVRHPLYKKYILRSSRLHAHDEENQCSVGDRVTIGETRPLSRTKSWALVRIEERALAQEGAERNAVRTDAAEQDAPAKDRAQDQEKGRKQDEQGGETS